MIRGRMKHVPLVGLLLASGAFSSMLHAQVAPPAPPTEEPAGTAAPIPPADAPKPSGPAGGFATAGAPSAEPAPAPAPRREATYPEATYPSPAHALPAPAPLEKPPTSSFEIRPASFEAHIGAGTPVGGIGLMLDYLIIPNLSLAGGFGFGSGPKASPGIHGAAMVRFRPAVGLRNAFVIGAGLSTGTYRRLEWIQIFSDREVTADWAHFAQVEFAWERRAESGFLIRVGGGFAYLLNPSALHCTESDYGVLGGAQTSCDPFSGSNGNREELLPVFDLALGHSF